MIESEKYRLLKWMDENEIKILLFSIIALVTIPPFVRSDVEGISLIMNLIFLPILVSCFLIIRKRPVTRYISIITLIIVLVNFFLDNKTIDSLIQLGISILVIHAFFLVIREAISLRGTRGNMILISITGYMIIGLLGGFLADLLEYVEPGSYYHSTGVELEMYNFIYYSYVTMTSLGYGDIIPVTNESQALALVMILTGQLYLAVIIAINVSKFLQKSNS